MLLIYGNGIGKLVKSKVNGLQKIQVLSAIHHKSSGSLHTFEDCKKYSESTVGTGTDVIPVICTLNIFAVCLFSLYGFFVL